MKAEQYARLLKIPAVSLGLTAILLIGCSSGEPPARMSMEAVRALEAELAGDPKRLKEMQRRCKYEREVLGEQVCTAVSGAARKRFMGSGKTKYTPATADIPNPPNTDFP